MRSEMLFSQLLVVPVLALTSLASLCCLEPAGPSGQPDAGPATTDAASAVDAASSGPGDAGTQAAEMVSVPAGSFEMGDHFGLGGEDPKHPSDEVPVHTVSLGAFRMGRTEVTCRQYTQFLNAAASAGTVEVVAGEVKLVSGGTVLATTRDGDPTSRFGFSGGKFQVLDGKEEHPATCIRWEGAAAFANWMSQNAGLSPCYDLSADTIDYVAKCYRLPTEAEWEYAATGGRYAPYPVYAFGSEVDKTRANWPGSGDPYESGSEPFTTPVGFYDGSLRHKADFGWPGAAESYQTGDGANPWGLADMSGNAWEWVNDWYGREYYSVSPASNPTGPTKAEASPMPDGKPYRGMRGGSWFNGDPDGHSRVSNRDPSYFRGPGDPNGPWNHVGFRLVLAHPD